MNKDVYNTAEEMNSDATVIESLVSMPDFFDTMQE